MGKPALFHVIGGSVIDTNWRLVLHYLLTVKITTHVQPTNFTFRNLFPSDTCVCVQSYRPRDAQCSVLCRCKSLRTTGWFHVGYSLEDRGLSTPSPRFKIMVFIQLTRRITKFSRSGLAAGQEQLRCLSRCSSCTGLHPLQQGFCQISETASLLCHKSSLHRHSRRASHDSWCTSVYGMLTNVQLLWFLNQTPFHEGHVFIWGSEGRGSGHMFLRGISALNFCPPVYLGPHTPRPQL